jgi:hypothetical protein
MRHIESLWIGYKGSETGICTKVDRATAIFGPREILGIGVMENAATQSDKALGPDL